MKQISDRNIILGLMLLQLAVTLPFINSFPIDLDEPFSIFYAQQDLSEFIPFLNQGNNPPLHFILLHYWMKLFGVGPVSVRSLSLLFSVLTLPVLYRLSQKVLKKEYSALVVLFFVFSTFNHYHALEARCYSLFVLVVVFVFLNLFKLIFEKKKVWLYLGGANAVLMYCHYLSGFIIFIEVLILIWFYKRLTKQKLGSFILSGLLSMILFFPNLILMFKRIGDFSDNGTWVNEPNITEVYGNIIKFFNYTISFFILIGLLIIFTFIKRNEVLERFKSYIKSGKNQFFLLSFLFPYLGMYLFSILFQPIFLDRYLLFTTPFLFILFVSIIQVIIGELKKVELLIIFILPMIFSCYYIPQNNREGDKISNYVKTLNGVNSSIAICPPFYDLTFIYHYDRDVFNDYKNIGSNLKLNKINLIYNYNDIVFSKSLESIIYIDANSTFLFPNNTIHADLKRQYTEVEVKEFQGGYKVVHYIKK